MKKISQRGFTLIEMLLVLVVVSFLIRIGISYFQRYSDNTRLDRTAMEMQQILNAGAVFYVAQNAWPAEDGPGSGLGLAHLQGQSTGAGTGMAGMSLIPIAMNFSSGTGLGAGTYPTPWTGIGGGASYVVRSSAGVLYVGVQLPTTSVNTTSIAQQLQGRLPLAITTTGNFATQSIATTIANPQACAQGGLCWVVASITAPAQSLGNAGNLQFANVYSHGGCVPAPTCPVDPATGIQMLPQIFVIPTSVSGQNTTGVNYPLYSFTAYATGDGSPNGLPLANTATSPPPCQDGGTMPSSPGSGSCGTDFAAAPSLLYWRACLRVVTDKGIVSGGASGPATNPAWGNTVQLLAVTRCMPPNEAIGSGLDVYGN